MKKWNHPALLFSMLLVAFTACKKNDVPLVRNFSINVTYPSSYLVTKAEGVSVTLTNTSNNTTLSATTDADGVAEFTQLLQGAYQVFATITLPADKAASINGYATEVTLNASVASQQVSQGGSLDLELTGGKVGGLVFKQVYYACSKTPSGVSYLQDQFYELYNNSSETIYADSLCIAEVQGDPGTTTNSKPTGFQSDKANVYVRDIWMVPGTGRQHPVAPGASFLIAQTAINHKSDAGNTNSIDLGAPVSDFEVYVNSGKDVDNPDVPNMQGIYTSNAAFYWLNYVYGASMIIFKHPAPATLPTFTDPGTTSTALYVQVPVSAVIDGVEFLANANSASFKRLPVSIDAGFNSCSGTYTGQAMMRKVKGKAENGQTILQDTNNSSADFTVIQPPVPKAWN